jgi:hypothetical protein
LRFTGAADRNRTGDLRITNALLYRLSYSGNTLKSLHIPLFVEPAKIARRVFYQKSLPPTSMAA